MYQVIYTARMKKDLRCVRKRGKDISKLVTVLDLLKTGEQQLYVPLLPGIRFHPYVSESIGCTLCLRLRMK